MQPTEKALAHNFDTPYMAGDLAEYFAAGPYRNILLLALTRSGTTREEIQNEFGNQGAKRLEELLKNGVLTDVRGVIKGRADEKVTFTQDLLRDALVDCIKHDYDQTKFGTGENWLSFQTESVDKKKAMALIRSKLQKVYSEIRQEILYSSEYYGNDKVFIGMVADSLLKGPSEAEGALQ